MGSECIRTSKQGTPRGRAQHLQNISSKNIQIPGQLKPTNGKQNQAQQKLQLKNEPKVTTFKANESHQFCMICKEKYNKESKVPVKICQEDHTICSACKDMLLSTKIQRYKICPFCKRLLQAMDVRVNQTVLASLK